MNKLFKGITVGTFSSKTFDDGNTNHSVELRQAMVTTLDKRRDVSNVFGVSCSSPAGMTGETFTQNRVYFYEVDEATAKEKNAEAVVNALKEQGIDVSTAKICQALSDDIFEVMHAHYKQAILDHKVDEAGMKRIYDKYSVVSKKTGEVVPNLYRRLWLLDENGFDVDLREEESSTDEAVVVEKNVDVVVDKVVEEVA